MLDTAKVGKTIAALRQARHLTQQQLAAVANVSHQAVSKWENGQALPDIQTLDHLAKLFGVTIDQLISGDIPEERAKKAENRDAFASIGDKFKDVWDDISDFVTGDKAHPDPENAPELAQLLSAAPFMSKGALEKHLLHPDLKLTESEILSFAPFAGRSCVEKLIERSGVVITWEFLSSVAPFLSREAVDRLVTAAQKGEAYTRPVQECKAKSLDDIGRSIGTGVEKAVRNMIEFGKQAGNGIAAAFENAAKSDPEPMSDRAKDVKKKMFQRALEDGKWDWIAAHMQEIEDQALVDEIVSRALKAGQKSWVLENVPGFADQELVLTALEEGRWDWLGSVAPAMDVDMQARISVTAAEQKKWSWLAAHADDMVLTAPARKLAELALEDGEISLAAQIVESHGTEEDAIRLCDAALERNNMDLLSRMIVHAGIPYLEKTVMQLAEQEKWNDVCRLARFVDGEMAATLTERAVEAGAWDAIDELSQYLK